MSLCQSTGWRKAFKLCVCVAEWLLSVCQGVLVWRRLAVKLHNASYVRDAR